MSFDVNQLSQINAGNQLVILPAYTNGTTVIELCYVGYKELDDTGAIGKQKQLTGAIHGFSVNRSNNYFACILRKIWRFQIRDINLRINNAK
jgi:hypothetical protein